MELAEIKNIGPKMLLALNKLGINSLNDLRHYYPYNYKLYHLETFNPDNQEEMIIKAIIIKKPLIRFVKKNLNILSFSVISNNYPFKVNIFNRFFLKNHLVENKEVVLIGKYNNKTNAFTASNIIFNWTKDFIDPLYHLVATIKKKVFLNIVDEALKAPVTFNDLVPSYITAKYRFPTIENALKNIHQPQNIADLKQAKLKLIYNELFLFTFKINYLTLLRQEENNCLTRCSHDLKPFIKGLPFSLTNDQEQTIKDIINDFQSSKRMNRLILGDVGSGKTIVAIIALYLNYLDHYQGAVMAPTELLANQHYQTFTKLLPELNIVLLTGKTTAKEKKLIIKELQDNKIDLVIGTHALLNKDLVFNNLGLIITDEQHRFGVKQRSSLKDKGSLVDILYLSATPIPRTYAQTLYGEMDISYIKDKPQNRKEVITTLLTEKDIKEVLKVMHQELKLNHQAFVIAPLINEEESDNLNDLKKLQTNFQKAFPNHKIAILHGGMKKSDQDDIMQSFINHQIDILVATTVIEVGIDIENATTMVIYNAERYGLATMHQLRGRIGRNDLDNYCFLISNYDLPRLKILETSNDGFYISEQDFKLRQEGDIFGYRQSGERQFKLANLTNDYKMFLQAMQDSKQFIKDQKELNFKDYPVYKEAIDKLISVD